MSECQPPAPCLLTNHAMYDETDPITKALLQVRRSHRRGYLCPCGKECAKVADLLRHYFSCDRVPILISGGVALRLAICHGQQTHGQRLAEDYRRLSALTASGEQVIGVTAAIQRAVDSMERLVRDEARRGRLRPNDKRPSRHDTADGANECHAAKRQCCASDAD